MSKQTTVFDDDWHLNIDKRVTTLEECIKSVKKNQLYMMAILLLGFLGTIGSILAK